MSDGNSSESGCSPPVDFATLERNLIDAVLKYARYELEHSPQTYFDYREGKELRYCDPVTWSEIETASREAFGAVMFEVLNIQEMIEAPSQIARDKACAVGLARMGHDIEPHFPGLLDQAAKEGWFSFIEKLHTAHNTPRGPTLGNWWKVLVTVWWASPLSLASMKHYWPLCFWSDEALVGFLELFGANVTLDQWRKFRRERKLKRPPHTIHQKLETVFDGSLQDGLDRKAEGFRLNRRIRRLPKGG